MHSFFSRSSPFSLLINTDRRQATTSTRVFNILVLDVFKAILNIGMDIAFAYNLTMRVASCGAVLRRRHEGLREGPGQEAIDCNKLNIGVVRI